MALQARQAATARSITKIQSDTGDVLIDHDDISKAFLNFYSNLYSSECSNDSDRLHTFFENLTLPTVSEEQNTQLNAEISIAEMIAAIKFMQDNKSPGPDGFTNEFDKRFVHELAPVLQAMFREALISGILPITLRQALSLC